MADSSPVIIWVANTEGQTEFVNKTYTEFFGVTYEEAEGGNWHPLVHPDDVPAYINVYLRSVRERTPFRAEARVQRADGEWRWIASYADPRFSPSGKFLGHTGISLDITARKQAEQALRESEERFRVTIQNSPVTVSNQDADLRYTWIYNGRPGFTPENVIGITDFDRFPAETAQYITEIKHRTMATRSKVRDEVCIHTENKTLYYDLTVEPQCDPDGKITGVTNVAIDITDRKLAEEALRESEERYRGLFNTLIEGFCIIEVVFDSNNKPIDFRFLEINPAFERQTGLHGAQGKSMRELAPDHEAHWFELYGKVALTGESIRFMNEAKALNRWFDVSAYRVGDEDSRKVAILFNDITEAKQAEAALTEAKQLLEHQVYLLQRALIPSKPPIIEGYPIASAYIPAFKGQEIGGDFLDVFMTEDGKVGILIGDVSGKGLEAAALAVNTRSTIGAFAYDSSLPGDALAHTNAVLYAKQADFEHFVTAFLAILDPATGDISYASAGHTPTIISRANGDMELLCPQSTPLGIMDKLAYEQGSSKLQPGDKMVLYTDGISEARSAATDFFGIEGIERVLKAHRQETTNELVKKVLDAVSDWAHGKLRDDTAVLIVGREDHIHSSKK